ncbi:MAG: hypothetical protein ABSC25_10930 [Roseiarcus sp.]|jgi:hypothetical protein
MATFITRVELHDATYNSYVQLHGFMVQEGYANSIRGGDGVAYHLPPAEYHLTANCTIEEARAKAARAARKTQKGYAILTSEYSRAAWIGLNAIPASARA